jgi:hypothetical protein
MSLPDVLERKERRMRLQEQQQHRQEVNNAIIAI